jgi:ankyrin repeat protein
MSALQQSLPSVTSATLHAAPRPARAPYAATPAVWRFTPQRPQTYPGIDAADKNGATALIRAAETGDVRALRALIADGADVNAQDKNGWTALMKAAKGGHIKAVADLIVAGADIRAETRNGWNALSIAVKANAPQAIALLAAATGAPKNQGE